MKTNDLRAMIEQEINRAQLIEALKASEKVGIKNSMSADAIVQEYKTLVRELATESKITIDEANKIVANALRNGGKIELEESTGVVISEGFFSRVGGFYRDVFQAAAKAFDPGAGMKQIPPEQDVQQAAKSADSPAEMMALLQQILQALQKADASEEGGTPEEEAAEDELVQNAEDSLEDIQGEIEQGDLTGDDEAAPGEGGGDEADKPLSIMKKQKTGDPNQPAEVPLVTYLQKQLKFGAKASQKIARNLSKQLSAAGVQVAESRILELFQEALLEATMHDLKTLQENRPRSKSRKEREAEKGRMRKYKSREEDELAGAEAEKQAAVDRRDQLAQDGDTSYMGAASKMAATDVRRGDEKIAKKQAGVDAAGQALGSTVQGQKDARAADKADRKAMEKRAKAHPGGAVAQTVLTHAARTASRPGQYDEEFMTALGADPKAQDKKINSIVKLLRRQMQRRGMDDATIKKALRLKEAQVTEMIMRKLEEDFIKNREAQK